MIDTSVEDLESRKATLAHLSPQNPTLHAPGYLVLSDRQPSERIIRIIANVLDASSNIAAELGCASVLCGLTSDDAELGDVGIVQFVGEDAAGDVGSRGIEIARLLGLSTDDLIPTPLPSPPLPQQLVSSTQAKVASSLLKGLQSFLGGLQSLHEVSFKIAQDKEVYLLWGYKEGWLLGMVGVALVME